MKYIKLFEDHNPKKQTVIEEMKTYKVGNIVPESTIYIYVQALHHTYDDFIDGDLGDRIEKYKKYKLMELNISDIDSDEFQIDDDEVEEFYQEYLKTKWYPPIVFDQDINSIVDGSHRANALKLAGVQKILAWVGID